MWIRDAKFSPMEMASGLNSGPGGFFAGPELRLPGSEEGIIIGIGIGCRALCGAEKCWPGAGAGPS